MNYKGKKGTFATFILLAMLGLGELYNYNYNKISKPKPIIQVERNLDDSDIDDGPEQTESIDDSSNSSINDLENDGTFKNLDEVKETIKKQYDNSEIYIDDKYNDYIKGIKVDGRNIEIEFNDGEKINGDCSSGYIVNIGLERLMMYESEYIQNYIKTRKDLDASGMDIIVAGVSVSEEFRLGLFENMNVGLDIDYSKCKNIWWDSRYINPNQIENFNNNELLETLILTNVVAEYESDDEILKLTNKNLKTFIISFDAIGNQFSDFDLNECENLKVFSGGMYFGSTNLEGIKNCKKLEVLDFGQIGGGETLDDIAELSVEEEVEKVKTSYDTSRFQVSLLDNVNISDLTAIMYNPSIEVINISLLRFVNDDHFFEVIQTLPNLNEIVGNENNSVSLYSEDVFEYCESKGKGIKHPFTEKTKRFKQYIRDILDSIITPEMSEWDQTEAIARLVLEEFEYDDELDKKKKDELTPEDIKRGWGETSLSNLLDGLGLCELYSDITIIFMTELHLKGYEANLNGHVYNIISIDGIYYELDLTWLDSFLKDQNISIDNFSFSKGNVYYMNELGDLTRPDKKYVEPSEVHSIRQKRLEEGIYMTDDYLRTHNRGTNGDSNPTNGDTNPNYGFYEINPNQDSNSQAPNIEDPNSQAPNIEDPNSQAPNIEDPNSQVPNIEDPNSQAPNIEDPNSQAPNIEDSDNTTTFNDEELYDEAPYIGDSNSELPDDESYSDAPIIKDPLDINLEKIAININPSNNTGNIDPSDNKSRFFINKRFFGVLRALRIARPLSSYQVSRVKYNTWTIDELYELCTRNDKISFNDFSEQQEI